MSAALPTPWTEEQFLDWAGATDAPYEFDGCRPIAMTTGTVRHNTVTTNIVIALRRRLDRSACSSHGPNLGIRTIRGRIRYPDGLITCARYRDEDRIAPDPRIVFEVVTPGSERMDRVEKVREYQAVPSILRYVIVDTASPTVLALHRQSGDAPWTATPLATGDTMALPEAGIEIEVAELYDGIAFPDLPELD